MRRTAILTISLGLGLAAAQTVSVDDPNRGGYSPRARQLVTNEGKTNVALAMNRPQYFTYEAVELTVTVTNPTPGILEIRDPSDERGPTLDLMSKDPKWLSLYGTDWGFRSPEPRALFAPKHPNPPTVFLASGHSHVQRLRSYEKRKNGYAGILPGGAPEFPGDYRFVYTYSFHNRATVDFKVVQPRVLASAVVYSPNTQPYLQFRDKKMVQLRRHTTVLALEGDGAYWVVTALSTGASDPRLVIDKNGHMTYGTRRTDLIRVARSAAPIVAVGGRLDAAENLTITWQDQSGRTFSAELDKDRKPRGNTGPLP